MTAPTSLKADVCVVGSGAGGGVVAALLAEAGAKVVLLEEGKYIRSNRFTQRDSDMYPLLFRDRGLQSSEDASVLVLQGSCVGGSTVVNMADITDIPAELFSFWRKHFALEGITATDWQAAAARVRPAIGVSDIEPALVNRGNQALLRGAAKLGLRGGIFQDNRVGCVGSGYCQIGCAYDAKRSVLVTYVPRALAAGATLLAQTRAERVLVQRNRVVGLSATRLDERGQAVGELRIDAPAVFLCAGAIHTPLILQRSRRGGRLVGRYLSLQPQGPVIAEFPEPMRSFRGIPQSTFIDHFERIDAHEGLGGFRIEGIFGPPGTASAFVGGIGRDITALLARYDHLAAALVLVPDRPHGRVLDLGNKRTARIIYTPTRSVLATLAEGMLTAAEVYLAAGAVRVWLPVENIPALTSPTDVAALRGKLRLKPTGVRLVSAHPQGTARLSDDKRRGVVGSDFQVHDTPGLYIADASIFPTTSSSHTMLPVMGMADLAARRFLAAAAP